MVSAPPWLSGATGPDERTLGRAQSDTPVASNPLHCALAVALGER